MDNQNQNNNDKKVISEEEKRRRKEKSMATKNKKSSPEYLELEKELRKIEEEEIAQRKLELKKRMAKLLK